MSRILIEAFYRDVFKEVLSIISVMLNNSTLYIRNANIDTKIELLSEVNNSYRTIISMLTLLLIAKGYKSLIDKFQVNNEISMAFPV